MSFLSKIFRQKSQPEAPAAAPAPVAPLPRPGITLCQESGSDKVVFKDLALYDEDGGTLVDFNNLTLSPGDRLLISGPAGCGKSACLAAMRNVWLLGGSGEITVPPEIRFVAQEEYFPERTLRGIVCAPDALSAFTEEQVAQALTDAGLGEFVEHMNDTEKKGEFWKNTLSGGQKNKLSFAGAFLHAGSTKVLIVDEITAALDAKSEEELYPRLLERMKHGIIISVAHHAAIAPQHNVFATVADGKATYTKSLPAAPEKAPAPRPPKV